jgi:disulfide bond formation protein DsbB
MATVEKPIQLDQESTESANARVTVARFAMYVALLAAWIAMCGSLYMSEVLGWIPCQWCWIQRIFMYPTAIILAVGLATRDRDVPKYALALAVPGSLASIYNNLLQKVPFFTRLETCAVGAPCSADYLNWFGFITIPMLALTAFVIIIVASVYTLVTNRRAPEENALEEGLAPALSPLLSVILIAGAIATLFVLSGIMTRSRQTPATISSSVAPVTAGASVSSDQIVRLYNESCGGCHGPANAGMQLIRPEFLAQNSDLQVLALIRNGRSATDAQNFSGKAMPANGGRIGLTDEELLRLIRYMREVK